MEKKGYRVRSGLVVPLSESKTYIAGEYVELSEYDYSRHAHQVETDEQYQERNLKPKTTLSTGEKLKKYREKGFHEK